MKTIILSAALLFLINSSYAQQPNPWESIGKTENKKMLTLSNGKYYEFHVNSRYVKVGSAIVDMKTNMIDHFVTENKDTSEYAIEPDVIHRWLSPDPLERKYPNMSPYVAMGNNPIVNIDQNGDSIYFVVGKQMLGYAKEMVMKLPKGKEIWEKYANSSTQNVYISIGSTGVGANGVTDVNVSSRLLTADNAINYLADYTEDPQFPGQQGTPSSGEQAFAAAFNGIVVDPNKKNTLIIVEERAFNSTVSSILHELDAHSCEGCSHETFGNEYNLYDQPGNNTPDSPADILNQQINQQSTTPNSKNIENKYNNSQVPGGEKTNKTKSKPQ